jgi:hypothetical protein
MSDNMSDNGESVELFRQQNRPARILTLFVGESAPHSGKFFYLGNTALRRHMQEAIEAAKLGGFGDFLERFKSYGWYLDDLVLSPVNELTKVERKAACLNAQKSLAERIAKYRPEAIVPLLLSIKDVVQGAARDAGSTAPCYPVPFAGMGQQNRFRKEMARILPKLPRKLTAEREDGSGSP